MITRKKAIIQLLGISASSSVFLSFCFNIRNNKKRKIENHRDLISAISEIIIPQTDTPGAKEAGVLVYVFSVFENCLSERDKRTLWGGLNEVEEYSMKKHSLSFTECTNENKLAILEYFHLRGSFDNAFLNKVKRKLFGPSFFELIKGLTVKGYCTSKIGATQGLAYEHIPVNYIACEPLLPNQKSWATV